MDVSCVVDGMRGEDEERGVSWEMEGGRKEREIWEYTLSARFYHGSRG